MYQIPKFFIIQGTCAIIIKYVFLHNTEHEIIL